MRLHEYQAKQLLQSFHGTVPKSVLIRSSAEIGNLAPRVSDSSWIVKAQIHAGGRNDAGGIRILHSLEAVEQCAEQMLGQHLTTSQTSAAGLPVHALLVEEVLDISEQCYLSILVDPVLERVVVLAGKTGSESATDFVRKHPDRLMKVVIDPVAGLQPYQCRRIAFGMELSERQVRALCDFMLTLYEMFVAQDLLMVEVSPLALLKNGRFCAVDIKVEVDDNALYRHPEMADWRDISQENPIDHLARAHGFRYREMNGDIGCLVNGAGIALATSDMLKLHGGAAASYLDVGASANVERVAEAFRMLISQQNIKAVMINIFGGIVHCDVIAQGIVTAMKERKVDMPVFARLEGNNAEIGVKILASSGENIVADKDLVQLTKQIVHLVRTGESLL